MNWKTRALGMLAAVCVLGALLGCEKPSGGTKKPDSPMQAPANTTDSK